MGRPRKPTYLKLVTGTAQPCRINPDEPTPSADRPAPPAWLNERAAAIFRETAVILAQIGLASASDTGMLSVLALRLEEIEVTTAILEDGGATYRVGEDRPPKRHPVVSQRSEAMRHVQRLLGEFGLSPATRSRVSANAKPDEPNPFGQLP